MVNIYDVAEKSGYSITTVSKALNNYPDISKKAREKVLKACKELGYMPNSSARTLSSKKSWTIGVVFSEELGLGITHPFFSHVIESFKKTIEENGYDLLFISREIGDSIYSYLEHCKYRNVDGVIIVHTNFCEPETREIMESTLPSVVIDVLSESSSMVTSDNVSGSKKAVEYLIELGHRRIAHISGNDDSYASNIRKLSFKETMNENGIEILENFIQSGGFFSYEGGYNAMKKLLESENKPTAVFVSGDYMAIGAINAIKDIGLTVPDDISVIGFDDVEVSKLISPSLTTVRQDTWTMGKRAAELLIDTINGVKVTEVATIPVELIVRNSTKNIT